MYIAKQTRPAVLVRARKKGLGDDIDDLIDFLFGDNTTDAASAPASDNVNATANGTTTSSADFTAVSGVCKPKNFPALKTTQEMQRQLNRVAQVKGYSKISVDGAVGPGTLALFQKVQAISAGQVMGDPSSCMGVAPDVDVLGAQIKTLADGMGAPATVSDPISIVPPTIQTNSGKKVPVPDSGIWASLAALSGIEKVALLGVAGGLGYLAFTSGIGGGKKKGTTARPTTARSR